VIISSFAKQRPGRVGLVVAVVALLLFGGWYTWIHQPAFKWSTGPSSKVTNPCSLFSVAELEDEIKLRTFTKQIAESVDSRCIIELGDQASTAFEVGQIDNDTYDELSSRGTTGLLSCAPLKCIRHNALFVVEGRKNRTPHLTIYVRHKSTIVRLYASTFPPDELASVAQVIANHLDKVE
jgi:hypothetical protein